MIAKGEKRKETKSKEFVAVAKLRSGKNKRILISILKQLVIRINTKRIKNLILTMFFAKPLAVVNFTTALRENSSLKHKLRN